MKRKKFTEEQIIKALKRIDAGEQAKAVCREFGVHDTDLFQLEEEVLRDGSGSA